MPASSLTDTSPLGLTATPAVAIDPAIVQQAAVWMARLWSGDVSEADHAACAAWRGSHPEHELAWQRLQAFENKLSRVPAELAGHALRQPAAQAWTSRRNALRMLCLGTAVGGLFYMVRGNETWQLAMAQYSSDTGEVRDLVLPDGSRLVLASASAVDLRFTATERLIVLRAGEILLTTAADETGRPLRVETRQGRVQALGTRFTVRQEADASRVAVFEGAVEIRPIDAPGNAVRLDAGQGARFYAGHVAAPLAAHESEAAWHQGILVAEAMRLQDVVAELSRYRKGVLRCDPAVANLRLSGVFPLRDTDRALRNLALGLPLVIHYRTRYWVTVAPA